MSAANEEAAPASPSATTPAESVPIPSDALIIIPVRNTVLFPGVVAPITIGRAKSIAAAQQALRDQRPVGILLQRNAEANDPAPDELFRICTIANIVRYITAPDETHHIICQGIQRARILDFLPGTPFPVARVLHIPEPTTSSPEIEARFLNLQRLAVEAIQLLPQAPPELLAAFQSTTSPAALADLATSYMDIKPEDKQEILETIDLAQRMEKVSRHLAERLEVLRLTAEIGQKTKATFDERQREAILREQMATIQRQLGEGDGKAQEVAELNEAIAKAGMPPEAESQAKKEVRRYERMPEAAGEAGMVRSYLDWLIELPWALPPEKTIDIPEARRILDEDHYGLEKIKSRIVEYLAVRKLAPHGKAPILCFVGPPGVGKTSLGQSIARAMDRPFVRVSLGGVHDEAEIRGHRRTYIGALPGNIIQGIKKAGARNCVMMLDEIDKMGRGIQGDPSAAMLEVLDPEQNSTFRDNYLGVPFDLSRVVFIATANMLDTIPGPVAGPHGDHQPARLHRGRKARDRAALSGSPPARGQRPEARAGRDRHRGAAADDQGLHPRGRRPFAGAGNRQGAAPCRGADRRRLCEQGHHHRRRSCGRARPAAFRGRDRHAHQRSRRGDRARLDAGRRRHSLHRGDACSRQGRLHPDRPARRRHARERAGRADAGEKPRRPARDRSLACSKRATSTSMSPPAPRRRTDRARALRCLPPLPPCSPTARCGATRP